MCLGAVFFVFMLLAFADLLRFADLWLSSNLDVASRPGLLERALASLRISTNGEHY